MILRPMLGQGIGLLLQEGMQVFLVSLRQERGGINVLTLSIGFKFLRGDGCRQMKLILHLMQGKAEFSHRGKDFLGSSEGQRTEVRLEYNEKKRSPKRHQLDLE